MLAHFSIHSQEWSSRFLFDRCMDDHGSLIIFRSASVRPEHLFDLYFESGPMRGNFGKH